MLDILKIQGNCKLQGSIKASGAKNATTKLLIASLISDKKCIFHNVPNIDDVAITVSLCIEAGASIVWDKEKATIEIETKQLSNCFIPLELSGTNRIPILMIGALVGRTNEKIIIPTVGGDAIGKRSVDFHLSALKKFGVDVELNINKTESFYLAQAKEKLCGNYIDLPYPSVGTTENCIFVAIRAKGKTIIRNAAVEPEILEIIQFLQKIGACISLEGDRTIIIDGVSEFKETEHHIMFDRMETASYAAAAIASKGSIFIEGAQHLHLMNFLNKIKTIGGGFQVRHNGIEFFYYKPLQGSLHLETDVHPGFMTDWQQTFSVLLTQTQGSSILHETVYENRLGYIHSLKKMGADIQLFRECLGCKKCRFKNNNFYHSAIINGKTELHGSNMIIPDIRAGFAFVIAGLIAEGESNITGLSFLKRGYDNFFNKLTSLGANIEISSNSSNLKQESQSVHLAHSNI